MADSPTAVAALRLDDRLCLALYAASRAMTARYREPLARLGLTYPQFLVMLALWEDGPTSVGRIGERLDLDSNTLSPLLRRLETMGLVTRRRDQADERSVTIALTPKGTALRRKAPAVTTEICAATGLPLADQIAMAHELFALAARLDGPGD